MHRVMNVVTAGRRGRGQWGGGGGGAWGGQGGFGGPGGMQMDEEQLRKMMEGFRRGGGFPGMEGNEEMMAEMEQRMKARQEAEDKRKREALGMTEEEYAKIKELLAALDVLKAEKAWALRGGEEDRADQMRRKIMEMVAIATEQEIEKEEEEEVERTAEAISLMEQAKALQEEMAKEADAIEEDLIELIVRDYDKALDAMDKLIEEAKDELWAAMTPLQRSRAIVNRVIELD